MTYCCGILVRDGLVMIADTRTNAGLDNVSTFRKLHIFSKPGERIMAVASAGNLAISQSVLSTLTEGMEDPSSGDVETLMNAPTMFQAAQRIGKAIRAIRATEGPALRSEDVSFDVSFLFGGQIKGSKLAPGSSGIFLPGEIEYGNRVKREKEGIPMIAGVMDEIENVANEIGVGERLKDA